MSYIQESPMEELQKQLDNIIAAPVSVPTAFRQTEVVTAEGVGFDLHIQVWKMLPVNFEDFEKKKKELERQS